MPFDPRLVPLFLASMVSLGLGVVAWRRRAPGSRAFAVLLFGIAEWAATYAMEIAAADLPAKLVWDQLSYIGSAAVGPAWLLFTLSYTEWGHQRPTGRRAGVFLLVMGFCVDQALVWSNSVHALMWTHAGVENMDFSLPVAFEYGPAYWVMLLYDYAVLLSGVWLIARSLTQSGRLYSRQSLALLLGVAAPLVANVAYQVDLVGTIDPTPFAFTITGAAFFWGFMRYRFLDLAPVARNSIFQVLRDAVLVLDPLDRVVDVNPAAERMLRQAATAAIGKPLGELSADLSALVHGVVDSPTAHLETALVDAQGARHYEVRVSALRGRGGYVTGRVLVLADITTRKAAEESVRASHQFIEAVIANAGEGIVVYDRALRYELWNPFMERITGWSAARMIGTSALEVLPELTERTELLSRALAGDTVQSGDMLYTIPDSNESGWYVATYAPRRDAHGCPDGVIGILHDITDRKRTEDVLSHRALHDALTDLPNRALFQSRLAQAIHEAHRDRSGMALLVIDLDRFKEVNDTLGHGSGDRLLQELGRRWHAVLDDRDTLARLGGDEFAVVLPTTSGRHAANLTADQLQAALVRSFVLDGHQAGIGASIGIAMYPEDGSDAETLLRHADRAMYAAKRSANSRGDAALDQAA